MPPAPARVAVRSNHPGSTAAEIEAEPDFKRFSNHRVGFRNYTSSVTAGHTHHEDVWSAEEIEHALRLYDELSQEEKEKKLVNWADVMGHVTDFHLRTNENRSLGWRYVLPVTEDFVRSEQNWPLNLKRRQQEQEEEQKKKKEQGDDDSKGEEQAQDDEGDDKEQKSEYEKRKRNYTTEQLALLRALEHERDYLSNLQNNDGKGYSPQKRNRTQISIDENDQFTPDNWLPRAPTLIRLAGKHPMNAEPELSALFDAGLVTPNELHYVRNHGAVPHLIWELHKIEFQHGKVELSMDDLKHSFDQINIPVALACDGNRRKEYNMVRTTQFGWGAGGVSCAYWKGPLLRDVLLKLIPDECHVDPNKRRWVNFAGADSPSEGPYETCIPLEYALNPENDVLIAWGMNCHEDADVHLPPDHGYPCRIMIPGWVGGRCVKWLKRIWISEKENDSHYHIWDNRVVPSFIKTKDDPLAEALFRNPSTACNEQMLNSVVTKPAQGEKIALSKAKRGETYTIQGYAYNGGGVPISRVEVSLDSGKTWLYCIRKYPDRPIRHSQKHWTWLFWSVEVPLVDLLASREIAVRAYNSMKACQPEQMVWNINGMMGTHWFKVKSEVVVPEDSDEAHVLFHHPTAPGPQEGGWMKPSAEQQMAAKEQSSGTPSKQFTREEIEKHDKEGDCWLVVDGKVYDATSVTDWHPGGESAILTHAGKVHQETTDEFSSVHDDYAYSKLNECVIGVVTEKAMNFIKQQAESAAKERAKTSEADSDISLQKHRWVPVKLLKRKKLSEDTRSYTFALPDDKRILGLGTCQHVQIGFHLQDKMLIRSYTPTRPLLPAPNDNDKVKDAREDGEGTNEDGCGTFELTVKVYPPTREQPGGAMGNILDHMPLGEEVEIRGPTGEIAYKGNGVFEIDGEERRFDKISLVLGGSGITPGYSLIARVMLSPDDKTQIRVVDANKSEADILLRSELDEFEEKKPGQLKIMHVLSHPTDEWRGKKGHIDADVIREALFDPNENGTAVFMCGPPPMIQKAALPALRDWGYKEDENCFGF